MKKFTKIALIVASFVLVIALSVGGTLAWLTATTTEVKNTFAPSDIGLNLEEHDYDPETNTLLTTTTTVKANADYKMVPDKELPKDPFVTVDAKSEECYVFIEVKVENNTSKDNKAFLEYAISPDWVKVEGATPKHTDYTVYTYKDKIAYSDNPTGPLYILAENKVTVNENITVEEMDAVTNNPTMSFYAYAIQTLGTGSAAEAWTKVPTPNA